MKLVTRHRLVSILAVGVVFAFAGPASTASVAPSAGKWRALKAPAPAWYTPELHARVMAAGPEGVPIPLGVDMPASTLAFLGIRPGQLLIINPAGSLCTSNFVFKRSGRYYIGTAGHCGNVGNQVTMLFLPRGLVNIGSIVFSVHEPDPDFPGTDFALIAINPALNKFVSPSMPYFGGPNGIGGCCGSKVVLHAGWGLGLGTGGTPRVGLATIWTPTLWRFIGTITPGDSGSAAIVSNGKAAGDITHISFEIPTRLTLAAGTTIARIRQVIGSSYVLQTCPMIPWPLYGCPHI